MRRRETERYLAYLGQSPRLQRAADKPRFTRRTMFLASVVALLALVLVVSYFASRDFSSNGMATVGQNKAVPTGDAASAFIQDIRNRINGAEECKKFEILFRSLLVAFTEGFLAT